MALELLLCIAKSTRQDKSHGNQTRGLSFVSVGFFKGFLKKSLMLNNAAFI